jgi:hypothetical protein
MGAVDRERPRPRAPRRETRRFEGQGSVCPVVIRRSVPSAVKHSVPWPSRTEPKTPWGVHAMKVAERTRNARGTGIRSIIQVAEVGRTHRAPCPSQGRKTP